MKSNPFGEPRESDGRWVEAVMASLKAPPPPSLESTILARLEGIRSLERQYRADLWREVMVAGGMVVVVLFAAVVSPNFYVLWGEIHSGFFWVTETIHSLSETIESYSDSLEIQNTLLTRGIVAGLLTLVLALFGEWVSRRSPFLKGGR